MMNSAFFGQLIILIVFIPILALQGVEGKMFIPMAMTFGFAVLGVVILCLTYIPMMAALFLQPPKTDKKTWGDKIIGKLENTYTPVIGWSLKRSWIVITIAFVLLISGGFLFTRMGAEFIPKLDEGDFAFQAFFLNKPLQLQNCLRLRCENYLFAPLFLLKGYLQYQRQEVNLFYT